MDKLTVFEHLRACAEAAKTYVSGLVGELAQTTVGAVEELESTKADKPSSIPVTIPTSGWGSDTSAGYPKYFDIAVTGVTVKDRAEITIAPESLDTAKACGLCPTNQTLAGKIRVRAAEVPTSAIKVEYWLENGKE